MCKVKIRLTQPNWVGAVAELGNKLHSYSLNPILARDGSLQLSLVILIKEFTKRIFSDLHQ